MNIRQQKRKNDKDRIQGRLLRNKEIKNGNKGTMMTTMKRIKRCKQN